MDSSNERTSVQERKDLERQRQPLAQQRPRARPVRRATPSASDVRGSGPSATSKRGTGVRRPAAHGQQREPGQSERWRRGAFQRPVRGRAPTGAGPGPRPDVRIRGRSPPRRRQAPANRWRPRDRRDRAVRPVVGGGARRGTAVQQGWGSEVSRRWRHRYLATVMLSCQCFNSLYELADVRRRHSRKYAPIDGRPRAKQL